jgi:DNA-binding Xre family transcriptional regulator
MKTIKFNLIELATKIEIENGINLSIRKIALKTGIRYNTLWNYFNGTFKHISVENLVALLQYFDCDLHDLIKYEEEE